MFAAEPARYLSDIQATQWINTDKPISLDSLRGKVVILHAFQMLCPGCVTHGIPQATALQTLFSKEDVQVIGLHSVFEHHQAMDENALRAFIHEYKISFPIAIDAPTVGSAIPQTMSAYQLKGTPSLIILDKKGQVRLHHFGRMSDMQVGSIVGYLLNESVEYETENESESKSKSKSKSKKKDQTRSQDSANMQNDSEYADLAECDDSGCTIK